MLSRMRFVHGGLASNPNCPANPSIAIAGQGNNIDPKLMTMHGLIQS